MKKQKKIFIQRNPLFLFKKLIRQKFKIEDILEIGKDSIIIGDFGSGKTTILKRIAFETIDKDKGCDGFKFPIFLLARNFANHGFSINSICKI